MKITRTSCVTGEERSRHIPITEEQVDAIRHLTDPAQVDAIVPNLTRADQWFLVLGITDYEWDALGAPVDEEC